MAGFFENIRANTQAMVNTNIETEKAIKTSVLTVLDRLHKEIKAKAKEFASGTSKGAKEVERARNATQKHIELLGQHTATYESAGGRSRLSATDDPYVVKSVVLHRLHKQVMEEKLDSKNVQLASVTKDKGFRIYSDEEMAEVVQRLPAN